MVVVVVTVALAEQNSPATDTPSTFPAPSGYNRPHMTGMVLLLTLLGCACTTAPAPRTPRPLECTYVYGGEVKVVTAACRYSLVPFSRRRTVTSSMS